MEKKAKLSYQLLPPSQLAGMAMIMNEGARTHEVGYMALEPDLYWDAAMRHLMALRRGEILDPESGMSHALHLACNGMILDRIMEVKDLRFGE